MALSLLVFMNVLSLCAGTVLVPRQPCPGATSNLTSLYACPPADTAGYPLSLEFSGPVFDEGSNFIRCVYPFLSNCRYSVTTGILVRDDDNGYCPTDHLQCSGRSCVCPNTDKAGYQLGNYPVDGTTGIWFCAYPTPEQLSADVYYCNYNQMTGAFIYGEDPVATNVPGAAGNFCPVAAVMLPTATCFPHSGVLIPTTSPTSAVPTSAKVSGKPPQDTATSPQTTPSSTRAPSGSGSHALHIGNLRLQIMAMALLLSIQFGCRTV